MAAMPQAGLRRREAGRIQEVMNSHDSGQRVLLFSSIGHALMHLMTAFYAVIVLTLAIAWKLPAEDLLRLYAPATILLGVMSLPAGWASDRFGAPAMIQALAGGAVRRPCPSPTKMRRIWRSASFVWKRLRNAACGM